MDIAGVQILVLTWGPLKWVSRLTLCTTPMSPCVFYYVVLNGQTKMSVLKLVSKAQSIFGWLNWFSGWLNCLPRNQSPPLHPYTRYLSSILGPRPSSSTGPVQHRWFSCFIQFPSFLLHWICAVTRPWFLFSLLLLQLPSTLQFHWQKFPNPWLCFGPLILRLHRGSSIPRFHRCPSSL